LSEGIALDFDFSPKKKYLFVEVMRQLTVAQRIWVSRQMTAWEVSRSREEIARENPQSSEEEVKMRWVELNYGQELAAELREYLKLRGAIAS
jgi:hypothetical protein